MAAENIREIVLETLLLITKEGQYSHIAINDVLGKYQYLEKKDRAFISRVVEGTLEHMIEIDYVLNQFSKVKVNKMKPVICTILRSSVYQMMYMDSVPDRAVCNEAVKLAERKGFRTLKGFVNGVLRNISRNREEIKYPDQKETVDYLSVKYSLPKWIVDQWLETYDFDTVEKIGKSFLEEAPLTVRCNLAKISVEELQGMLKKEGVDVIQIPEIPYAFRLEGVDYLWKLESFQKGYFYVQDISSMQVAEWANPKEGSNVIDVCAAPGGKAIHVAEMLKETGHVLARDLTEYKVGLIKENIEKSRLSNIDAEVWDATVSDKKSVGQADIVIADLPCSGLGVIGKKPDLKYNMTREMQKDLVELQREILETVCEYVKPGGKLLYSTCTIHKGENEDNTNWFLDKHSEFSLERQQQRLPGTDGSDGFYIACMRKQE